MKHLLAIQKLNQQIGLLHSAKEEQNREIAKRKKQLAELEIQIEVFIKAVRILEEEG